MRLTLALFFLLITASYSDTLLTFTLTWDPPDSGDATGYYVYMGERSSIGGDGSRNLHLYAGRVVVGNQLSIPIFLNHPRTYFTVTAVNEAGEGPPSNELVVTSNGSMSSTKFAPAD